MPMMIGDNLHAIELRNKKKLELLSELNRRADIIVQTKRMADKAFEWGAILTRISNELCNQPIGGFTDRELRIIRELSNFTTIVAKTKD